MAICLLWGLLVALAHGARGPLGWIAGGYIQVVRNTPLLIQLYLVYFGFSMAGFGLSGFGFGSSWRCVRRTAGTSPRSTAAAYNRSAFVSSRPVAPSHAPTDALTRRSFCHRS